MIQLVNQSLEMASMIDMEGLLQASQVVNSFDSQYFAQLFDMMSLDQITMVAQKVVEVNNGAPQFPGIILSVDQVTPFLTTIASSTEAVREFVARTLDVFFPFAFGGTIVLSAFKGIAAVFKALLGRFKEAIEDIKWVGIGVAIMCVLPTVIEAITEILLGRV